MKKGEFGGDATDVLYLGCFAGIPLAINRNSGAARFFY